MTDSLRKFDGRAQFAEALQHFSGKELYRSLMQIYDSMRKEYFARGLGRPAKIELDERDEVLYQLFEVIGAVPVVIQYEDFAELFERLLEKIRFAVENGTTKIDEVPGFQDLKQEIRAFESKKVAELAKARGGVWNPES